MQCQSQRFLSLVRLLFPKGRSERQSKSSIVNITIRLFCLLGALLLLQAGARAQTVTLTVTGPQSGTHYYAGDSFLLTVTGAPNSPVRVLQNGVLSGVMGTTNSSGVWSVGATWGPGDIGSYTEIWYVAGVAATPQLSFSIAAPPKEYIRLNGRVIAIENN